MIMFFVKNIVVHRLSRLVANPYLTAVRDGLTMALPIIIVATLAVLMNTFPSQSYAKIMASVFGPDWRLFGTYLYGGSYGIISLIMVLSISYSLAERRNARYQLDRVNPGIVAFVAFSCLFCLIEPGSFQLPDKEITAYISRWFGVHGLLLSTVVALVACSLFFFFSRFRALRIVLYSGSSAFAMTQAMSALLPALLTFGFFVAIKILLCSVFGVHDINESIYHWLYMPFRSLGGDNLETALVYGAARHFLWFIGVHGSNVLEPVMQELYVPAIQLNMAAHQIPYYFTEALPGQVAVFTKTFFDCYTSMGGAGSTIGLLLACLIGHTDSGTRKVARISILPCIFNVNEILLFGLPVVLNPLFLLPFLLVPLLCTVTAELATLWGLVPVTTARVEWNIPILLNAYEATGSIRGSLLQVVNVIISTLIYLPFVLLDNKIKGTHFKLTFDSLVAKACDADPEDSGQIKLLSLPGPIGALAQSVAMDMRSAKDRQEFFCVYQPQVNSSTGQVVGVESLIRWDHAFLGAVPPPLLIGLAEETNFINNLGLWSLETSVKQLARWRDAGGPAIVMSVNVSSKQLHDANFPDRVAEILQRYAIPAQLLKIELTESLALTAQMVNNQVLSRLSQMGIALAIDDFGMGHSSITYVKQFRVDTIKLDAMLTRDVLVSKISCDIISSIVDMCQSMKISIVAEFVEDEAHLLRLRELGCQVIQGYFYSRPLAPDACLAFLMQPQRAFDPAAGLPVTPKNTVPV